ncbi:MAG: hypothetical protein ACRDGJ_05685 [Candidatus Limnocylindria bacterium]
MKSRIFLLAAAVLLALPKPALASGPPGAVSDGYARDERALGADGSRLIYESVAVEGTLLTDELRRAVDWTTLGSRRALTDAAQGAQSVHYKTIGRRMTAVNNLGWVVIQYTIWQEFGYDGTRITYGPPPTYDQQANWGWRLVSHAESSRWITKSTYRTSRGDFAFEQEIWSPYGYIGLGKLTGWVAVYFRGTGAWTGTNS